MVSNTIHHLLEHMGSAFRDLVPIVGHWLTMGTRSLKALPICSSKWCIELQTDSCNKNMNILFGMASEKKGVWIGFLWAVLTEVFALKSMP